MGQSGDHVKNFIKIDKVAKKVGSRPEEPNAPKFAKQINLRNEFSVEQT
jgi:hypothetical protein